MIWFKNAIIYQFNKETLLDVVKIEQALKEHIFVPCGSLDSSKMGWVSPYNDANEIELINVQDQLLLKMKKETKLLPSTVVKKALNEKIEQQEHALNRKLKKTEKLALKDDVFIDLIPRAFSKYQYYWLWIDSVNRRLIVDTSSYKMAEEIIAVLRKSLGSLALTPLSIKKPVEQVLTTWVKEQLTFPPLALSDEIELKDPLEGNGIVRCRQQDIDSDEIKIHISAGKLVTKMKVTDANGIAFIINKDLSLKQIKFDPTLQDKNEDFLPEEKAKRLEADFCLMNNTLSNSINELTKAITQIDNK